MRIMRKLVLPMSLFALSACNHARTQVVRPQPAPVVQKAEALSPVKPTVTNFATLGAAAESVMRMRPPILAFGEVHKVKHSGLISSMQHFARQIMPLLPKYGFHDLVMEIIPYGQAAAQEIKDYNQTGKFGPIITELLNEHPDRCGIIEIINQARDLGITLHGAHTRTLAEYYRAQRSGTLHQLIKRQLVKVIKSLRLHGKPVVVYAGSAHNRIAGDMSRSIAGAFTLKPHEFDIGLAEDIEIISDEHDSIKNWAGLIPTHGANLIIFPNSRMVALLPPSSHPVTYFDPKSPPPCPSE